MNFQTTIDMTPKLRLVVDAVIAGTHSLGIGRVEIEGDDEHEDLSGFFAGPALHRIADMTMKSFRASIIDVEPTLAASYRPTHAGYPTPEAA